MSESPYDILIEEETDNMSKPITTSKTFWANVIVAAVGVLTTLGNTELITSNPQVAGIFVTVIGVANVLLRLVTSTKVTIKK